MNREDDAATIAFVLICLAVAVVAGIILELRSRAGPSLGDDEEEGLAVEREIGQDLDP